MILHIAGGCPTGEARITKGYNLPATWIIHTVGPVWHGGSAGEARLLAQCYENCFTVASRHDVKTMAFPSISTGAYGYPIEKACTIALNEINRGLEKHPSIEKVSVICFDEATYDCYVESPASESSVI